jgi:hypothetical protein
MPREHDEQGNSSAVTITITPRRVTVFFSAVIVALTIVHGVGQFSRFYLGDGYLHGFVPMFTFGSEHNVPAYYSALAMVFCAVLLAIIATGERKREAPGAGYWWGLAAVFLFLAFDEALELHESLIAPTQMLLGVSGDRYFVWILPYAMVMLVIAIPYARFMLSLAAGTRRRFILAAAVFLSGAVGLEIVGGLYYESVGEGDILFVIVESLEDLLEMAGVVIFIHALMYHICTEFGELRIRIAATP